MAMKGKKDKFYLVNEVILPEAIKKTIKVKSILQLGEAKTINNQSKFTATRCSSRKYFF